MENVLIILGKLQLAPVAVAGAIALASFGPAQAGPCDAKAAAIAAQQGGKLLGARAKGKKCQIRLLIKSRKGPPKRKTIIVQK